MRLRRILSSALFGLAVVAPAAAQQQVRIQGRVVSNEDRRPLSFADVTLRRPSGGFLQQVQTDSLGNFEFIVTRLSAVRIRADRVGYRANTTPTLHFDDHSFFQVEVRLDTEALLLAPLEVIVWSEVDRSPLLDAFRDRRSSGVGGIFITRGEIEQKRPMYVSDLLRTIPGVQLTDGGAGHRPVVQIGRTAGANCDTQIFVDGMLLNRRGLSSLDPASNFRLDDAVSPGSVEGIEIYKGVSTIPPEFLTPDAACGVIAVWTRRGGAGGSSGS